MRSEPAGQRPVVLVLIKGLGIGGAEKLISEGARHWDRSHFDYRVAYVLPWKNQLVADIETLGIPVKCLGTRRGLTPPVAWRLRRLIRDSGAVVVHAHLPTAGILARLVSPVPVVYTEHNLAHSYRWATRVANRLTYSRNRAVTAVSGAVASTVTGYLGAPVEVVPNGVAVAVDPEAAFRARDELGLAPNDPLVVHVGNIRPGKGHELLVEATAILVGHRPKVTVVSIGGEKYPGSLARLCRAASDRGLDGRLRFLGRRPDALAFTAAADVYVNPADIEGLPVTILEAMSLGRPVIATAAGGVPSVVRDEETGLLVEPGDAAALAGAINRLLADRRYAEGLARAGADLVARDYGLEPMIRAFESIYWRVLG
jgi:glycosyltransferase involved in cell wall biosynthesis